MSLTLEQKSNVRRHLGYPVIGLWRVSPLGYSTFGVNVSWRYFQAWGQLEFRLSNLMPDEEARLLGLAFGSIAFVGGPPVAGNTINVTINNTQTFSVIATQYDTQLTLCQGLANAMTSNAVLAASGFQAISPYGTGPYSQTNIPMPQVAFTAPAAFTIAFTATGNMGVELTSSGSLLTPQTNFLDIVTSDNVVLNGFMPILDYLEGAIAGVLQNQDTIRADVWFARSDEMEQRRMLYNIWRRRMAEFIGIPPLQNNPGAMSGAGGQLVV